MGAVPHGLFGPAQLPAVEAPVMQDPDHLISCFSVGGISFPHFRGCYGGALDFEHQLLGEPGGIGNAPDPIEAHFQPAIPCRKELLEMQLHPQVGLAFAMLPALRRTFEMVIMGMPPVSAPQPHHSSAFNAAVIPLLLRIPRLNPLACFIKSVKLHGVPSMDH
jgi:hypothetical protein